MKKYLFIAAVAAMSLASCSKNVVLPNMSEQNAITVGVYADRALQTKGLVTTAGELPADANAPLTEVTILKDGFYMNAVMYKTGETNTIPNFMYNQLVTWEDADGDGEGTLYAWKYSPVKYWPTDPDVSVDFHAWAPKNAVTISNGAATDQTVAQNLDFALTMPKEHTIGTGDQAKTVEDLTQMVDFVAASTIGANGAIAENEEKPSQVTFYFKHELTRVNFTAMSNLSDNVTSIVVRGARILFDGESGSGSNEIYTSGTYTFSKEPTVSGGTAKGSWNYGTTPSILTADLELASVWSKAGTSFGGANSDVYNNESGCPVVSNTSTKDSPTALFTANEYLFLLPVAGTEGVPGTTAATTYVEFDYDVITIDNKIAGGFSTSSVTKKIALPAGILQQGIAYNICFNFSMYAVEIGNVTVEGWDTPVDAYAGVTESDGDGDA